MKTTLFTIFALTLSLSSFASEPTGYYNQGFLKDGECLPPGGEGFTVIQLSQDVGHIFGTTEMIDMLEETAADMQHKYPGRDRLQIEDIAQEGGGDIDPHGSHENGLDADIQYFKADGRESMGKGYAASMLNGDGSVSSNFDVERNWELMKSLNSHGKINMIFIDRNLSARLIEYARETGDYNSNRALIQKFHHVDGHDDHLHVRLMCPASAKSCHSTTVKKAGGA
ncbi:MAG: penicillin-insensitive murein endopeptidase [Bacteriovoracaceae bacterium]